MSPTLTIDDFHGLTAVYVEVSRYRPASTRPVSLVDTDPPYEGELEYEIISPVAPNAEMEIIYLNKAEFTCRVLEELEARDE